MHPHLRTIYHDATATHSMFSSVSILVYVKEISVKICTIDAQITLNWVLAPITKPMLS